MREIKNKVDVYKAYYFLITLLKSYLLISITVGTQPFISMQIAERLI